MSKLGHFLREAISHDGHLVLAFVAAAVVIVSHLIGLEFGTETGILAIVMIAVLSLAADGLFRASERRENTDHLKHLVKALSDRHGIFLRDRPYKPEDYFYLWDNFSGQYRSYSPAYHLEKSTDRDAVLELYVRRYQNQAFKANYLFLTGDACGKDDLKDFRLLMGDVRRRVPNCENQIQVKELATVDAAPSAELYIGTRAGNEVVVLELRHPALGTRHGEPRYYAVIDDPEVFKTLRLFFDEQWTDATDVKLFAP